MKRGSTSSYCHRIVMITLPRGSKERSELWMLEKRVHSKLFHLPNTETAWFFFNSLSFSIFSSHLQPQFCSLCNVILSTFLFASFVRNMPGEPKIMVKNATCRKCFSVMPGLFNCYCALLNILQIIVLLVNFLMPNSSAFPQNLLEPPCSGQHILIIIILYI